MINLEQNRKGPEHFPTRETVRTNRDYDKIAGLGTAATTYALGVVGALLIMLTSFGALADRAGGGGTAVQTNTTPGTVIVSTDPVNEPVSEPTVEEQIIEEPTVEEQIPPETQPIPETHDTIVTPYTPPNTPTKPDTPTPVEPSTPQKPTIKVGGITLWESLNHVGVEIGITANDAADLSTSLSVMAGSDSMLGESYTGGGTFTANIAPEELIPTDATWSVSYSMGYTLDGKSQSDSDTMTSSATVVSAKLNRSGTPVTSATSDGLQVQTSFVFDYSADTRHDYNVRVRAIDLGWLRESDENYSTAGDIRSLWDGSGESPVTASKDSSARKITFSYNGIIPFYQLEPPENGSGATAFYLAFFLEGTGTDENTSAYSDPSDAVYKLRTPLVLISSPIEIPEDPSSAPEITIDHVYAFNELNVPGGLRRAEVAYTIEPNAATDFSSKITVSYPNGSKTIFWTRTGSGSIVVNESIEPDLVYSSSGWHTEIETSYMLYGVKRSKTVSTDTTTMFNCHLKPTITDMSFADGAYTIKGEVSLDYDSADPTTYSATLSGAGICWATGPSSYGDEITLESDKVHFDAAVLTRGGTESTGFVIQGVKPPAGVLDFLLTIDGNPASGEIDGTSYPYSPSMPGAVEGTLPEPTYDPPSFDHASVESWYDTEFSLYRSEAAFAIKLEDAAGQAGTASLYYKQMGSDTYSLVDGQTIAYEGNLDSTWNPSSEDKYLGMSPSLGSRIGAIDWIRIRFNYELPNGTTGFIESDEFPVCMGSYILSAGSGTLTSSGFSVPFTVDTDLVEPSGVTGYEAWIEVDGTTVELPASCISSVGSDGSFSVSASAEVFTALLTDAGVSLSENSSYALGVVLEYVNGDITWPDSGTGTLVTTNAGSPTVTIDHVWAWNEVGKAAGLRRAEVAYTVEPNSADNISSDITISYTDESKSLSWTRTGSGSLTVNESIEPDLVYPTDGWHTEVKTSYTVNGVSGSKTVSTDTTKLFDSGLDVTIEESGYADGALVLAGTVRLVYDSLDPAVYTAPLSGARICWATGPSSYGDPIAINSDNINFDEPAILTKGGTETLGFLIRVNEVDSDATDFLLIIDAENAAGEISGTSYPYAGGISGDASGSLPTPSYEPPSFDYAEMESWDDGGYTAEAYVTIVLNDAAEQEGELSLYYKRQGEDDFTKVSDSAITYYGDYTDTWDPSEEEDYLTMYPELGSRIGAIDRAKIHFDYELPDGTTGFIESKEFPICMGTFVSGGSGVLRSTGFSVPFTIDTSLVDPSYVEGYSAFIVVNDFAVTLPSGSISEISSDGKLTVSCSKEDLMAALDSLSLSLDEDASYSVGVELMYEYDDVSWGPVGEGVLLTADPDAPTLTMQHVYGWSKADVPGALERLEIAFSVDPKEVAPSDLSAVVTFRYTEDESMKQTWNLSGEQLDGAVTIEAPLPDGFCYPTGGWTAAVELNYSLDGESGTVKKEMAGTQFTAGLTITPGEPEVMEGAATVFKGLLSISQESDDAAVYIADLGQASVGFAWVTEAEPTPTTQPISVTFGEEELRSGGSVSYELGLTWRPGDATGYILSIDIPESAASGELGDGSYTYVGGLSGSIEKSLEASMPDEIFGYGEFTYDPDKYFGGSIELLDEIDPDVFDSYSFQLLQDLDGSVTDVTEIFGVNAKKKSGFVDEEGWICFEFNASAGDSIPELNSSAKYSVIATVEWGGETYVSNPYELPPLSGDEVAVEIMGLEAWGYDLEELDLEGTIVVTYPYSASVDYSAEVTGVNIQFVREDDVTTEWINLYPSINIDGADDYEGEIDIPFNVEAYDPPSLEYTRYRLLFTVLVKNTDGYENNFTVQSDTMGY